MSGVVKSPSRRLKRDSLRMLKFNCKKQTEQISHLRENLISNETKHKQLTEEVIRKVENLQKELHEQQKEFDEMSNLQKFKIGYLISQVNRKPNLSISRNLSNIDIHPILSHTQPIQPSHHPAVLKACQMMYGKPLSLLSPEEVQQFEDYKQWKINNGMPIEVDPIYSSRTHHYK